MKTVFLIRICVAATFGLVSRSGLVAQLQIQGQQHTEYSVDQQNDDRYFESWTHFVLTHENWRLGFRYEIHTPPQPFSQQTPGQGFYQRFIEYRKNNLTITAGNFYSMFGRGIVFRSYENRTLRWDTNVDGLKFVWRSKYVDVQAIGGKPRDPAGQRYPSLQGGEIKLKPTKKVMLGGSFLVTEFTDAGNLHAGSIFTQFSSKTADVYGEYARSDHPLSNRDGEAKYLAASVHVRDLNVLVEYKDYDHFDISNGVTYNNPPTAVREHLYTLLNRHQLAQNPADEKGYMIEATYPVAEGALATFNHSRITNHRGEKVYEEFYGQGEIDHPQDWQWVVGAGRQKDREARFLNFVLSSSWKFTESKSLKAVVEHQHAQVDLTDRKYYSQVGLLAFSESNDYSISLLGEHTTDQLTTRRNSIGMQFDVHFWEKYDVSVFVGSRREGKICAGGVCVQKPEFKGIEMTFLARL